MDIDIVDGQSLKLTNAVSLCSAEVIRLHWSSGNCQMCIAISRQLLHFCDIPGEDTSRLFFRKGMCSEKCKLTAAFVTANYCYVLRPKTSSCWGKHSIEWYDLDDLTCLLCAWWCTEFLQYTFIIHLTCIIGTHDSLCNHKLGPLSLKLKLI